MVDEIFDRGYQAGRSELHDGIDGLVRKLRNSFAALAAAQAHLWDAPWNARRRPKANA